jgi:hypothetical protein
MRTGGMSLRSKAGVYLLLTFGCLNAQAATWSGRVERLIVDNGQNAAGHTRVFLETPSATLELEGAAALTLRAGDSVEVEGMMTRRPGRINISRITPLGSSGGNTCGPTGEQRTLVILASFPSKALLSTVTPALLKASFFGTGQTINEFVRESSNGLAWVTGDVIGPFTMDGDYFDQPLAIRDAAIRAASGSAILTQYTRIVVVAPQGQTGMESGGMALLGCGTVPSPQGDLTASSIWLGAESLISQSDVVTIAAHEMGHAFGLQHARLADYGADVLGPAGQAPALWDAIHDYGDPYSNMGRNLTQWAGPQRSLIGWLSGASVQSVSAAGTYTISPYEYGAGIQALRVSRDATGTSWLWLEFRQPLGKFDTTLPAGAFDGLLAHYEDSAALTPTVSDSTAAMYSNLVNFHPNGTYAGDPFLHAGQSWSDPYGPLRLAVTNASANGITVTVSYAAAPVCASSITGSASFTGAGGTGQATVSAPAGCQWKASASASWIQVAAAGGTVSYSVNPNPGVSPRWAKIQAGDAFLVITEDGASAGLTVSPSSQTIPASGGTGVVSVATTAPDYAWTFGTDVEWITDAESSSYQTVGPETVRYIVAANSGGQRTGHITFNDQVFTITQDPGTPANAPFLFTQLNPQDAPSARLNQALGASPIPGHTILYGGAWNTTFSTETWMWNGSNWALLNPANNPGLLAGHAMALDKAHNQLVLFGGTDGVTFGNRDQTWVFDGVSWTQMHPTVSPPARFGHAMAYDEVSKKVVMFGGWSDSGTASDTWLWDGANWTEVQGSAGPSARANAAMAFDTVSGEMILFGGMVAGSPATWPSDTWAWDGSAWHLKNVAAPPPGRIGHAMAYSPVLGAVVMVGGTGGKDVTETSWNYDFRRETWVWKGSQWTEEFPDNQPGPAYTLGAVYDPVRQAVVVHVGDDLTCDSRGPKTFTLAGSGQ